MTDQPAEMFTDLRLVDGLSVVTCKLCGSLVADIEAHQRAHSNSGRPDPHRQLAQDYRAAVNSEAQAAASADKDAAMKHEDMATTTEHDAALFEQRRALSEGGD